MDVLVVDRSAALRRRVRELIEDARANAAVHEAEHLDHVLGDLEPSAIVLDIHLPANDGLDLLVHARQRWPGAIIIVLTNQASEVHRRECTLRGADHFFDKSRKFEAVARVILDLAL